jgi:hypothetical protein
MEAGEGPNWGSRAKRKKKVTKPSLIMVYITTLSITHTAQREIFYDK